MSPKATVHQGRQSNHLPKIGTSSSPRTAAYATVHSQRDFGNVTKSPEMGKSASCMIWVGQIESQQSSRVSESGRWHYGKRGRRERERKGRSEDFCTVGFKDARRGHQPTNTDGFQKAAKDKKANASPEPAEGHSLAVTLILHQ